MNNSCEECPCFRNSTETAVQQEEALRKAFLILFIIGLVALVMPFLAFFIDRKNRKEKAEKAAETVGVTEKPIVPEWLRTGGRDTFTGQKGVRFEWRIIERRYHDEKKKQSELYRHAIDWLESKIYEGTTGAVHPKTCLASVPMENFKCGQTPNDFSPISGSPPGSFLTYQMFGDNKIQVTYYVEDGKTYPAGYCVYIEDPYLKEHHYSEEVIEKLKEGLKYEVDLKFKREYESAVLQKIKEKKQRVLNKLTMQVCESTGKIVAVGLDQGDVMHYEWSDCYEHFVCVNCKTCQLEGNKDAPPPYKLFSDKEYCSYV